MPRRREVAAPTPGPPTPPSDPELEVALKRVLELIHKEHPLRANQILALACELQRLGVHRLVEEHLARANRASR